MALFHAPSLFFFPPQTSLTPSPTSLLPHGLKPRITPIPFSCAKRRRRGFARCLPAVVEDAQEEVVFPLEEDESEKSSTTIEEYDWREEWYPLYLSSEVPSDAPLGLTVFHKQLVLYRDGAGVFRCFEDRCPHRLAKLSEGQLIDGRLECLYHGWQFEGDGKCVKIPQLPDGAKIPRGACARAYQVRDSQGIVWVWMSNESPPNNDKLPFFEQFELPGFCDISTIHELPYDHSILLENLMDPAHVPISHDRTDFSARREEAQPLVFDVVERTSRGFAGKWWRSKNPESVSFSRFQAPCVLSNSREIDDGKGGKQVSSALFLCRPAGQGKSMLIVRFGSSSRPFLSNLLPQWFLHQISCNVFEQDMGFLSSQNALLMKAKVPTKDLYLNLKFCDTWVVEYRRWMDKVGHGMPYYFGHSSVSLPKEPAVVEEAPVGFAAGISSSFPAKGGVGDRYAPNLVNRYYRHVVHCKECRSSLQWFQACRNVLLVLSVAAAAAAVLVAARQWKALFIAASGMLLAGACACTSTVGFMTRNLIRKHRRL